MSHAQLFKKAGVEEYDLYTLKTTVNEVQLRGFDVEIVRGPVESIGYTCRALSRRGKLTGLGRSSCSNIVKLKDCIESAKYLSSLNLLETEYEFPSAKKGKQAKIADNKILKGGAEAVHNICSWIQMRSHPGGELRSVAVALLLCLPGTTFGEVPTPSPGALAAHAVITDYRGPSTCVACHEEQARAMFGSVHYQEMGDTPNVANIDGPAGKGSNGGMVMNSYCGTPASSSRATCATCHAGNGRIPSTQISVAQLNNIDCMMCHQDAYKRVPAGTFKPLTFAGADGPPHTIQTGVEDETGFDFIPDTAKMTIPIAQAAQTVHLPTRASCLRCHAGAGGIPPVELERRVAGVEDRDLGGEPGALTGPQDLGEYRVIGAAADEHSQAGPPLSRLGERGEVELRLVARVGGEAQQAQVLPQPVVPPAALAPGTVGQASLGRERARERGGQLQRLVRQVGEQWSPIAQGGGRLSRW